MTEVKKRRKSNFTAIVIRRIRKDKLAMFGLSVIVLLFIVAIFAPLIANNKPIVFSVDGKLYWPALKAYPELKRVDFHNERSLNKFTAGKEYWSINPLIKYSPTKGDLDEYLGKTSARHPLGMDANGYDVLTRIIYGTRVSLLVGFVAMGIAATIGIFFGALAGYYGGWVDTIISRFIEIVICFPSFFLILAIIAVIGPSIFNIMIVIGITGWTGIARLVRGEFLKYKNHEFTLAARALGIPDWKIIFKHILPNAIPPALVSITFGIAGAILTESALSFLGFGVQPPTPSWGETLSQAREHITVAWWLAVYPGIAIFITVTCYNLLGEGLRDALDPRISETE
jgi:peptide/nickel transport system permease protein